MCEIVSSHLDYRTLGHASPLPKNPGFTRSSMASVLIPVGLAGEPTAPVGISSPRDRRAPGSEFSPPSG